MSDKLEQVSQMLAQLRASSPAVAPMAAQDLPHDDTDMQASTADDKEGSRDSEAKHDGGGARGSGVL